MKKKIIGIVDYGFGNHASILFAIKKLGFDAIVTSELSLIKKSDAIVLCGVGAFSAAVKGLKESQIFNYLKDDLDKPILGICLGMQLLASESNEGGRSEGLNLIPGKVKEFEKQKSHTGWNAIQPTVIGFPWELSNRNTFYFNHSFYYEGEEKYILANSEFIKSVPSVIRSGNIIGVQFHPEKSQIEGHRLLKNLLTDLINA